MIVRNETPRLILMDMNFSLSTTGEEGLTLLKQVKLFRPEVPVILMTAWGSIGLAVDGMKAGAFDFVTKPWNNMALMQRIETALQLTEKQHAVKESISGFDRSFIIGESRALNDVLKVVERIAKTNASVLITGESGTGKELIAEAIHRNSKRADKPFVKVNLGGISQSLFESEMFGHKKGAFTDAVADRKGRFELADKGTIFLDEIGEICPETQVKLLRVLQEGEFMRVGGTTPIKVNVQNLPSYGDKEGGDESTMVGLYYSSLPTSYKDVVETGMKVRIGSEEGKIEMIAMVHPEDGDQELELIITMDNPSLSLRDGEYDAELVLESTTPISFLWN